MTDDIGPRRAGKARSQRITAIAHASRGKRVLIYCLDLIEAVREFKQTMAGMPELAVSPFHPASPPGIDDAEYSIALGLGGELRFVKAPEKKEPGQ